jgi:hypothetical protein
MVTGRAQGFTRVPWLSRLFSSPCHDPAALGRPGSRRRGPLGARRPRHHPSRARPCDPQRRDRRGRHLRPRGERRIAPPRHSHHGTRLLARPLAKRPLPCSGAASDMGAAYWNRTDDLRITRSPQYRTETTTCTDRPHMRPGMLPAHSVLQIPGHNPGHVPASRPVTECYRTGPSGASPGPLVSRTVIQGPHRYLT